MLARVTSQLPLASSCISHPACCLFARPTAVGLISWQIARCALRHLLVQSLWMLFFFVVFTFKHVTKYFIKKGSKVYCAFLDASKAFDKVLHNGLFVKLA